MFYRVFRRIQRVQVFIIHLKELYTTSTRPLINDALWVRCDVHVYCYKTIQINSIVLFMIVLVIKSEQFIFYI